MGNRTIINLTIYNNIYGTLKLFHPINVPISKKLKLKIIRMSESSALDDGETNRMFLVGSSFTSPLISSIRRMRSLYSLPFKDPTVLRRLGCSR